MKNNILTTTQGTVFDLSKPAKSNLAMILDTNGFQVMDTLKLTGNVTNVSIFGESVAMIEVETSFGITEIDENFIWQ